MADIIKQIDNSQGAKADGRGWHWLQSFRHRIIANRSVIASEGLTYTDKKRNDSGYVNGSLMLAMAAASNELTARFVFTITGNGYFHRVYSQTPSSNFKEIYLLSNWDDTYPSCAFDLNNYFIYTNHTTTRSHKLGRAIMGQHTSGNNEANKLIDTTKNFVTLGIVVGDKITNLTDGGQATITSITTSTNANDTLNFTGGLSGGTDNDFDVNDWYFVWDEDWKDLGTESQFTGQATADTWMRQILILEDLHIIANGNYLSSYTGDGSDWVAQWKQLPEFHQFACMDDNNGKLLVGANRDESSVLLLWDTYSDGWLRKKKLKSKIYSIKAYGNGWLVFAGYSVYYTDGYNLQKLADLPDNAIGVWGAGIKPNGMIVMEDLVAINIAPIDFNRRRNGVWVLDIVKRDWQWIPYNADTNKLCINGSSSASGIFFYEQSTSRMFMTWTGGVVHRFGRLVIDSEPYHSMGISELVDFGRKVRIDQIAVNMSIGLRRKYLTAASQLNIRVAISPMTQVLLNQGSTNAISSAANKIRVNGSSAGFQEAQVGFMVWVTSGNNGGFMRQIISIANAGTATEEWTLDSDLPTTCASGDNIQAMPFYTVGTKTFSMDYAAGNRSIDKVFFDVPDGIPTSSKYMVLVKLFDEDRSYCTEIDNIILEASRLDRS